MKFKSFEDYYKENIYPIILDPRFICLIGFTNKEKFVSSLFY